MHKKVSRRVYTHKFFIRLSDINLGLMLIPGRLVSGVRNPELFTLQDRHSKSYILSPVSQ